MDVMVLVEMGRVVQALCRALTLLNEVWQEKQALQAFVCTGEHGWLAESWMYHWMAECSDRLGPPPEKWVFYVQKKKTMRS